MSKNNSYHIWFFRAGERGYRLSFNPRRYLTGISGVVLCLFVAAGLFVRSAFFSGGPTSAELKNLEQAYGSTLDNQVNYFSEEISRVQRYESDLSSKSAGLETILKELGALNPEVIEDSSAHSSNSSDGLGGQIEPMVRPLVQKGSSLGETILGPDATDNLVEKLTSQLELLKGLPLGRPVPGRYTSGFGNRYSPFTGRLSFHHGMDFAGLTYSDVNVTAPGIVKRAGYWAGFGKTVIVEHVNGYETVYGHLSRIEVEVGDDVCRGQLIGRVGSTGRSTGPHLHYEVRLNGAPKNPKAFIEAPKHLALLDL